MGLVENYKKAQLNSSSGSPSSGGLLSRWKAASIPVEKPMPSAAPFIPTLPTPVAKPPAQFIPRLPSLAELNKVDKTQPVAPAASLPANPFAKLLSNKVDRFMSNPQNAKVVQSEPAQFVDKNLRAGTSALNTGISNVGAGMAQFGDQLMSKARVLPLSTLPKFAQTPATQATVQAESEAGQQRRANVRADVENQITTTQKNLRVTDKQTQGLGYGVLSSLPQMATLFVPGGQAAFFSTAAGNYASQAEKNGASPDKALAYGLIGGAAELATEKILFLIPQSVRKVGQGLVSRIIKAGTGEGVQEAITGPIMGMAEKFIYNPEKSWYGPNGVIDPEQMGKDALAGAVMGVMFMGLASSNPQTKAKAQAAVAEAQTTGAGVPLEVVQNIASGIKETNPQTTTDTTPERKAYDTFVDASAGKTVPYDKTGKSYQIFDMGTVSSEEGSLHNNAVGINTTGYKREIDDFTISHALDTHNDVTKEAKHGQIPISPNDFKQVLDVMKTPDSITRGSKTREGYDSIRYTKRVNGHIVYVEAVIPSEGLIVAKSLWKKNADYKGPGAIAYTGEPIWPIHAQNDSTVGPNSITPPNAANVNAPNGSIPADVAGNPELNVRWKPEEVEAMASGREPLPEDLNNLMALADHVVDLQDSGRMDLQHFAATVSQKVSKVYENTFKQNGLDKEFPEIFNSQTFVYDPRTEKAQLQKANAMINANPEGEFKRVTALDGEEMTADDVNVSGELMKKEMDLLRMNPENPDAIRRVRALADTLRQAGTSGGQQIQAFAKYSRRTPEGFTALANKLMDKVEESLPEGPKEQFNKETKTIEDMGRQVEQEAAQKLADELDGAGIIPEPAGLPKEPGTAQQPTDAAGTGNTGRDTARDGTATIVDEPSFAEQLASKISDYADVKKKGAAPDPVQDMLNELLRLAKESPIEDVRAAARKARNPVQFALQALDAWPRYKQVYADAQGLLKAKYADNPDMLARLNEFFGTDTRPPISTQTLSAIVRNGLNDVGIKMTDILNNNDMRKKLVNHIIESTGAKGDPAYFLRNFLNERMNVIQAEFNKKQMKVTDPDARYRLLYSLYETNLKKEFVPSHIKPVLKDMVTGLDAPAKASGTSGKASIGDIVRDYYSTGKKKQGDVIDAIIDKTGLTGVDADNLRMQLYGKMAEYRKEFAKKAIQRLTAEKKISVKDPAAFGKKLTELANEGALSNLAVKDLMRQKFGLPTLEGKDVTFILKEMDAYQKMPEGAAKDAQYEKVLKYMGNKMPKSAMEQFNSWRRMAMLLSARTHISNIAGNAANRWIMQKPADAIALVVERLIMRLPPEQRSKAFLTKSDRHLVDMAKADFEANKRDLLEGSNRYDVKANQHGLRKYADTFNSQMLNWLNKLSKDTLGAEDAWFYGPVYKESMAQFMKARGLNEVTIEARGYAKSRAEDVTFRRMNAIAEWLNKAKQNKKGFGAQALGTYLDIKLPFVNTPSNIAIRGVEFSPVGIFNIVGQAVTKQATPSQLAELIGKSVYGSLGTATAGAVLQALGFIDMDDKEGLTMVLPFGKFTIDWLQPLAMSLAFGAAGYKSMIKNGVSWENALDAFIAGGDTLFNMGMLQNVKEIFGNEYSSPTETLLSSPADAAMQGIPAVGGQFARSIDQTVRSTYDTNPVVAIAKRAMAKTPGLSFLLPAKIDAMGKEMKQAGPVSQFLLPGRMVQEPTGRVADESKRLYEALKKSDPEAATGVKLNPAPSKFTRDSEQIVLTAKELEEFSRKLGEERERQLGIQMSQSGWSSLSDGEKAKRFKAARDKAADITKDNYVKTIN